MRRIIDLTHPITAGMPVYPGDPEVRLEAVSLIKDTGYHITEICMSTHTGTHIDAPMHCLPGAKGVDSAPLNALVGPAEVLNLGDLPPKTEITAAHLDRFSKRVEEGARLLLRTGWSKRFGSPEYFTEYPGLTEGAAVWLNARRVQLVAIEQPSAHLTQDRKRYGDVPRRYWYGWVKIAFEQAYYAWPRLYSNCSDSRCGIHHNDLRWTS